MISWKIQLTIANNFISLIDNEQERVMHSKSDIIEIMINDEADEVIKDFFDSLKKYVKVISNQGKVMSLPSILFIYLLQISQNKSNCSGSYIGSPDSMKKNTNKKDNKCFQYAGRVALNYEEIKKRSTTVKRFINKCNCKGINFSSEKDYWKKIEKNNVTLSFNVLDAKKEKIYLAYVSKNNSNREIQAILLITPHGKG